MRKLLLLLAGLLLFAAGCGDESSGPSDDITVTVTAPPAAGASATDTYNVTWTSSSSGTVALFYNTAASPLGQVAIESDLAASGSYSWDLSGVPDGVYFVRALITSDQSTGSDWSDGALTVDHSGGEPGIAVTAPGEEGATADTTFTVTWVSSGYTEGIVTLSVDDDTDPSQGLVQIAADIQDNGSFVWDCSSFTEGYYYVHAVISDTVNTSSDYSQGMLTVDHGGLNPDFYITRPPEAGAEADNIYTIQWESTAPLNSTVDLFYDTDQAASSGLVEIETGIFDDGYYSWDCSSVPEGTYYIYGILTTPGSDGDSRSLIRLMRDDSKATVTDYSNGTITITHTAEYSIEITEPPASGASADQSFQIVWTTDAPSTETMDLYYSADTTGSELYPIATLEPPAGTSFNWDCSSVEEGSWYIFAALGSRGLGYDWSAGTVNITHEQDYSFEMVTPPVEGATANDEYLLIWNTDAPAEAYVSLYYGESVEPGGTVYVIASALANSGQYNWPCGSIPEGEYFVYGVVSDAMDPGRDLRGTGNDWSDGTVTIDHTGYSINITSPSSPGEPADSTYTVEYSASGASGTLIDLYYDTDNDPTELTEIATGLTNTGTYSWTTLTVGEGEYYVYGIIYDPSDGRPVPGTDEFAQDYSEGTVLVSHEYNYIFVTSPPSGGAAAEDDFTIMWAAASQAGAGTVDVYFDTDTIPSSGLELIAQDLSWDDYQYFWDCSEVPADYYYIYAELTNPAGTFSDYSNGMLQIIHDNLWFYFTSPPPPGATADNSYDLKWYSTGSDERLMDLYYDTDTDPSSGLVEITEDVVCPEYLTVWTWNCSSVPEGTYYIYGVLSNPVTDAEVTGYSEGTLTIEH